MKRFLPSLAAIALVALTTNAHAVTSQTFDGGGTDFTLTQHNSTPAASVVGGGPSGSFLRLGTDGSGNQNNTIAFDAADSGTADFFLGSFDFRMGGAGDTADGMGVAILNTTDFGTTGGPGAFFSEETNLANSIGFGLDNHDNGGGDVSQDSVTLHFNGSKIAEVDLTGSFDMENNVFNRALFEIRSTVGGLLVDLVIIDDVFGTANAVTVFDDEFIAGGFLYEGRMAFSARTGGLNGNHDIDNVFLQTSVPEPTTATLALFGLAGIAARRRRVA